MTDSQFYSTPPAQQPPQPQLWTAPAAYQPIQQPPAPKRPLGKNKLYAVIAVLVLALVGAGAYVLFGTGSAAHKPSNPLIPSTAAVGDLDPATLSEDVRASYQADADKNGLNVTVTVICIPKPVPRTFSCVVQDDNGGSASHEVIVSPAGDSWVTSN